MDYYDKLDNEDRAWSVCEVARFLGYNTKYVYELIRKGKIEGWFVVNGNYKFCPAKFKVWLEKTFGANGPHKKTVKNAVGGAKPKSRLNDLEQTERPEPTGEHD